MENQFESLPNEILIDILQYLDARDLYRAFYNLNSRLNTLIQSLNDLSLILSICDRDEIADNAIFLPYIDTLIIKYKTDIKLHYYPNVHRLIFFWLPYTRPYKLENVNLPHLEYLSINLKGSSSSFTIHRLHETIFSSGFPRLKYCSLPKSSTIQKTERWTKLPSLRILKVGYIGLFTYIAILSTCINLHSFHFFEEKVFQTSILLRQYFNHENLKRLVINEKYIGPILHSGVLNEYLSCVPNLEYLSIHVITYHTKNLPYLMEFDWFGSTISSHLSFLQQFHFHLPIFRTKQMNKFLNEDTFQQLEKCFKIIHKNPYQSRLFINRKSLKHSISYESSDSSD